MSEANRTKIEVSKVLGYYDGEFKYRVYTITNTFDTVLGKWVKSKEEISYAPLESMGLTKKPIQVDVILIKRIPNLLEYSKDFDITFWKATFEFFVPESPRNEYVYLYLEPESKTVHRNHVNCNFSAPIDFNDKEYCRLVSEPKQITRAQAQELVKTKQVYPRFLMSYAGSWVEIAYYT